MESLLLLAHTGQCQEVTYAATRLGYPTMQLCATRDSHLRSQKLPLPTGPASLEMVPPRLLGILAI
eukprot:11862123-Karenia_brevis.AAC.1